VKSISVVSNARLQSSRVPKKLVRPFAGRTLIEIALEKLDRMDFFEHRYLAVAEPELIELAKPFPNVEVLRRKNEAVKQGVNPQSVTFAHYREVPSDYVFVFNPCLPLLSVATIRRAFDYFQTTDHRSYTAVIKTGDWIFDSDGNALTNSDPANVTTNKNRTFYKGAHAFHIVKRSYFEETGQHWTFAPNDPHLIEIPEEEAADVDTEMEFALAELLYQKRVSGGSGK
jgi:CMP-N-acetylneuraminic acid synthetase